MRRYLSSDVVYRTGLGYLNNTDRNIPTGVTTSDTGRQEVVVASLLPCATRPAMAYFKRVPHSVCAAQNYPHWICCVVDRFDLTSVTDGSANGGKPGPGHLRSTSPCRGEGRGTVNLKLAEPRWFRPRRRPGVTEPASRSPAFAFGEGVQCLA